MRTTVLRGAEREHAAFFRGMRAAAMRAQRVAGAVSIPLEVAGLRIDLVFAGPRLMPQLVPALRSLVVADGALPQMRVLLWDSHSTGVAAPPAPARSEACADRGEVREFRGRRYCTACHSGERSVSVMDLGRSEAIYWVRVAEDLPAWVAAAPLQTILHWSLERHGVTPPQHLAADRARLAAFSLP